MLLHSKKLRIAIYLSHLGEQENGNLRSALTTSNVIEVRFASAFYLLSLSNSLQVM